MILKAFAPEFRGTWTAENAIAEDFLDRCVARVESGTFVEGLAEGRNHYTVVARDGESLHVRASDLRSQLAIGLNEVILDRPPGTREVAYRVAYRTWGQFHQGMGLLMILLLVLGPSFGLSIDLGEHGERLVVAVAFFGGVILPAVLTRLHRRRAKPALLRTLRAIHANALT